MIDPKKPFIEFCCMGHEVFYTEDFHSEDEDCIMNFDTKGNHSISFMPEPYDDAQIELSSNKFRSEAGVQCDPDGVSISHSSLMPAVSCTASDKILKPNPTSYSITHTARVFFPYEEKAKFRCRTCGKGFKNMQALGGHMSRKHIR